MPILSTSSILLPPTHAHDPAWTESAQKQQQESASTLKSRSSLANLVQFARNPVENANEVFEDWLDGSTKAERAERQIIEDRKQLLYLKLHNVRIGVYVNLHGIAKNHLGYQPIRLGRSGYKA